MRTLKVRLAQHEVEQMESLREQWFETYGVELSASKFIAAMYRLGLRSGMHINHKQLVIT